MSAISRFMQRQAFFPTWAGLLLNPFYFARRGLAASMRKYSSRLRGRLLDVGCGSKPYQALFTVDEYVGLEIESDASRARGIADLFYDGKIFPLDDGAFDSVLCNQVLEHVFQPDDFLREIHRILKPDGKLLLTVPFVWDEHEQPFDYARYSSFGLRALLEKNDFRILQHEKIGADASALFQLVNVYLYKLVEQWPFPFRPIATVGLMGSVNAIGMLAKALLPRNADFFLDQVVLAEKR
jgi:SAM-dependent methyltransferase